MKATLNPSLWRLATAIRSSALRCAGSALVPHDGGGMTAGDDAVRRTQLPVHAHFGEQDHWIARDSVEAFRQSQPGVAAQVCPANHGFNCDPRGSYNRAAAALALQRTLAFLAMHLG